MPYRLDVTSPPLDAADVPENPLRSFRMWMLAHGFIEQPRSHQFRPDRMDHLTCGVLGPGGPLPIAMAATVAILLLLAFAETLLVG